MPSRPSPLRTWLQLFRAPNLVTVPGDPIAGYLLASFSALEWPLGMAVAASLCFYASGLLLNDLADLEEDRAERPERPLPSGAASHEAVGSVMVLLAGVGLGLCALLNTAALAVGLALAVSIAAYNLGTKRLPGLGALNMGACRGLSLLLGATAVPHGELTFRLLAYGRLDHLILAAALVTAFIAAVTHLAFFETRVIVPTLARWLPAAFLAAGAGSFLNLLNPAARVSAGALLLLAFVLALQRSFFLEKNPAAPLPPAIGELIRLLLLIQAAFCAAVGGIAGTVAAAILLLCWPLGRALSHRFYAS